MLLLAIRTPFCLSPDGFDRGVSSNDFPCLEASCKKIIKEKQPFERLEIKKETLLEMFKVPGNTHTYLHIRGLETLDNVAYTSASALPLVLYSTTSLNAAF